MDLQAVVSGFGDFEEVEENPSGALARRLERFPPPGWRVEGRELSVSFARAPEELDAWLEGLTTTPDLLLAMGVHREAGFRLEARARGGAKPEPGARDRRDVDGQSWFEVPAERGDYDCVLPVEELARELAQASGERVWVSSDAGGYVCERLYHRLLRRAAERDRPALFVHVPPLLATGLAEQERVVRVLFDLLARRLSRARGAGGHPPS